MQRMCCVCHKTYREGTWCLMPPERNEPVTHGYCPECFALVMSEIQSLIAQRKNGEAGDALQILWHRAQSRGGACV
nr:hypothetical protein [uncultured Desulfobulbus sp.]